MADDDDVRTKETEEAAAEEAAAEKVSTPKEGDKKVLDPKKDLGIKGGPFHLDEEELERLKKAHPECSFWKAFEEFCSAKSPEEACQALIVKALLFIPNQAAFLLERRAAAAKERNKKIEEAIAKYDDVVAKSKGLDDAGRLRSVHKEMIEAAGDMSAVASKLYKSKPRLLDGLKLDFKDGELVGKMSKKQEAELRRRVLKQGYYDTYGHQPTGKTLKNLEQESLTLTKNGGYKQMHEEMRKRAEHEAADDAHGTGPKDDPKGPKTDGPSFGDKVGLFDRAVISALGHIPDAAAELRKDHPEVFKEMGIKFDKDGFVKGELKEEQIRGLMGKLSEGGYLKKYGLEPSKDGMEKIIQAAMALRKGDDPRSASARDAGEKVDERVGSTEGVVNDIGSTIMELGSDVSERMNRINEALTSYREKSSLNDAQKTASFDPAMLEKVRMFSNVVKGFQAQAQRIEASRAKLEKALTPPEAQKTDAHKEKETVRANAVNNENENR